MSAGQRGPKNRFAAKCRKEAGSDAVGDAIDSRNAAFAVGIEQERELDRERILEVQALAIRFSMPASSLNRIAKMLESLERFPTRSLGFMWRGFLRRYESLLFKAKVEGYLAPFEDKQTEEEAHAARVRSHAVYENKMARITEYKAKKAEAFSRAFKQEGEPPPKPPRKKELDE